jgi:hypothetical protein
VAATNLTLFFTLPGATYYTTPAALIPKLYANSMLMVLNARFQILGGRATYMSSVDFNSTPSYIRDSGTDGAVANERARSSHLVTINREVFSDGDLHEHVEMKDIRVCSNSYYSHK